MKFVLYFFAFVAGMSASAENFRLSSAIHSSQSLPFLAHSGDGPWDNYLILNLNFEPVAELFRQLLVKEARQLTSRGEAHITVVTPIEYWQVLKPQGISMAEINQMAIDHEIQSSKFRIDCLGRGEALIDGVKEQTYYIVVSSNDLLNLRAKILELFLDKGGKATRFDPEKYHPHITLGFSKRDLHESDGVVKDKKSCIAKIASI